ncbi:putative Ulp1 protease family catalytic domain, papain-like cysteine peptidase superfamily [Helianthus annuus]|nr:putative Ulp1 protease family catalytic domain, papain-like cysteine peptidase superfamily [Helianthus annuus]
MIDLYNSRQKTNRWCILPPHFQWSLFYSGTKNVFKYYFDGSLEPLPRIDQVDEVYVPLNVLNKHWLLGVFHLHDKTLTIYDSLLDWSLIDKERTQAICDINFAFESWLRMNDYYDEKGWSLSFPFKVVYPDNVPQQFGSLGDCGIWVCIFMERLINNQPLLRQHEQPKETAMQMRHKPAIKLYDSILEDNFDMASTSQMIVDEANKKIFPD